MNSLKAWLTSHLTWIQEGGSLAPRSIVLTGLPGTGKHSAAKAIAAALGKPLVSMEAADNGTNDAVLLIDTLGPEHLPLVRRLADPDRKMPFTIMLTERPWELPSGLLRPDAVEAVWHLDLPDQRERCDIWELAVERHRLPPREFDQVLLARASHEHTPAEIHAALTRAARASHPHSPKERQVLNALCDLQSLARAKHEELARMIQWTTRCALAAR